MTLICPTCQRANRRTARFCAGCGIRLLGSTMPLQSGQLMRNGDYRIVSTLNKGGMGVIYLAQNLQAFERLCVIKEMLDYFDPNNQQEVANARKRFELEARTLAQLHHPGIPNLQAFFSEGSHNYIVMEYVEGMSLDEAVTRLDRNGQVIAKRQLGAEQVIQYGVQLCLILEYLAQIAPPVVHHDIKPANIIIDKTNGEARLVDFGTAKSRFALQAGGQVGLQQSSIYGTAGYAPPEQYNGESEARSDVYALAATLYHLLADDDPSKHPFSFPKLNTLPLGLAPVLKKALESNVKYRTTATQLKNELKATLDSKSKSKRLSTKISSTQLNATSHESFSIVATQGITDSARAAVIQLLQIQFGLSEVDAEVITWQIPTPLARGLKDKEAEIFEDKLKRLGVQAQKVLTSQLLAWRANVFITDPKLMSHGELKIKLNDIPRDRICDCYRCGHEWKTKAKKLLRKCPNCKSPNWTQHRLFLCAVCYHTFTHGNLHKSAKHLFPQCPACHSLVWQASERPRLKSTQFKQDIVHKTLKRKMNLEFILSPPDKPALRGRVIPDQTWLKAQQTTFHGDRINIEVDGTQLIKKTPYLGNIRIISNGGTAVAVVNIYMNKGPRLVVHRHQLDFGVVKAVQERKLKLIIKNSGGEDLQGTITGKPSWLELSQSTFKGNKIEIWLTVFGHKLPLNAQNSARLKINSNGGQANILVIAHAIFPQLTVYPLELDFGSLKTSDIRHLTLTLSNSGGQLLRGSISTRPKWLHINNTLFRGNKSDLKITVNGSMLSTVGLNDANLTIKSNGGSKSVRVIARAVAPKIVVNTTQLNFGTLTPQKESRHTLLISNQGGQSLKPFISAKPSWVNVEGEQTKGGQTEFRFVVRGAALPNSGLNKDKLTIGSNGGSVSVEVLASAPQTLLITKPRQLRLGQHEHSKQVKHQITLSNSGFGMLTGQAATSEPWLTVEPTRFNGNMSELTLIADTARLTHGKSYTAQVTIISNGGREVIPVQIEIDPTGRLSYNLQHNWRWRAALFLGLLSVFGSCLVIFGLS